MKCFDAILGFQIEFHVDLIPGTGFLSIGTVDMMINLSFSFFQLLYFIYLKKQGKRLPHENTGNNSIIASCWMCRKRLKKKSNCYVNGRMIHWDPLFFKGQAAAWFISLFLSDTTEWINWIENHCSNCCMGTYSSLGPNFEHISFSGWPFPVAFSFSPLVYSSIMVANYNYPIQVTCFFPLWILKTFCCSSPFFFVCLFQQEFWLFC